MNECTFWELENNSYKSSNLFHLVKSMYSVLNTFVEIILALTVKSLINFWLMFAYGGGRPTWLFCMWIYCCPTTICWKRHSFLHWMVRHPCWNQLTINARVYFWTLNALPLINMFILFVSTSLSWLLELWESFEIRKCESSNFVLLFARLFWLFWVLWFTDEF